MAKPTDGEDGEPGSSSRETLIKWWAYHVSPDKNLQLDGIAKLEPRFAALFPGTVFRGTRPRAAPFRSILRSLHDRKRPGQEPANEGAPDFYFLLERGDRIFDIAEMSSGEQTVFTLLYDFIRLGIRHSVVLIDELELHLHAPAQQALFAALPKLGPDCQFIVTTHSEFLSSVIPGEQQARLSGGRLCL